MNPELTQPIAFPENFNFYAELTAAAQYLLRPNEQPQAVTLARILADDERRS